MNKHSIIATIAIIAIVSPILYGMWGIFSSEQMQLRTPNSEFSYFEMSSYEEIKVCNPLPFFASFSGLRIETHYGGDLKGVFVSGPTTIDPKSSKIIEVDFSSDSFSEAQYLFMHMDGQFDGEIPIRIDPSKMVVQTTYENRIMGVIPYQSSIVQSGFEFTNMMNEASSCEVT